MQLQTRTDVQNYGGDIVLTDDAAFVPTSMEPDGIANVYRLDFATGELGDPIEGVSATWDILLSASGNVLMATGEPSTVAFFDLESGELIDSVELDITNMETPFSRPVQLWGDNPIVITGLGEVYVITDDPASP